MKGKFWNRINENLTGILGTLAFHMAVAVVILAFKISSSKSLFDDVILIDFDEKDKLTEEIKQAVMNENPEFEEYLADYLERARTSNIPVNIATRVNEEISTEKYVDELLNELNENRTEEWRQSRQKLQELLQMESTDEIISPDDSSKAETEPGYFQGLTNIYYSLENRYDLRLPVPVYKCEGDGIVEVKILVNQKGEVVNVEAPDTGDSMNDDCLEEAAKNAALRTRFNSDFNAPYRQQGTITYHFQPQY